MPYLSWYDNKRFSIAIVRYEILRPIGRKDDKKTDERLFYGFQIANMIRECNISNVYGFWFKKEETNKRILFSERLRDFANLKADPKIERFINLHIKNKPGILRNLMFVKSFIYAVDRFFLAFKWKLKYSVPVHEHSSKIPKRLTKELQLLEQAGGNTDFLCLYHRHDLSI